MRKLFISALVVASAGTVQAQAIDPATGAILGGIVGNAIGKGNTAATVVGAVVGAQLANRQNHNPPPTYEVRSGPAYAVAPGQVVGVPVATQPYIVPCDEQYYEGVYDPRTAYRYCQGVRERYLREWNQRANDAYNRGLRGY